MIITPSLAIHTCSTAFVLVVMVMRTRQCHRFTRPFGCEPRPGSILHALAFVLTLQYTRFTDRWQQLQQHLFVCTATKVI